MNYRASSIQVKRLLQAQGLWQAIEPVPETASATPEAPEVLERQASAALILHTWIASQL
ncbi:hypothetical protein VE00_10906 [Pseudogymnoascus sp. WSF 3629]|nr:hypothetical protein VE00_10906 [Pseudogymnoascus sp. WSF 3629]